MQTRLNSLCAILNSSSSIATPVTSSCGWWTRRIHISRFYITPFYTALNTARNSINTTKDNVENAVVSVIQHCPNLEIFVEQPLKTAFGPVADALKTYASRWLRTVQWNVTETPSLKSFGHSIRCPISHPSELMHQILGMSYPAACSKNSVMRLRNESCCKWDNRRGKSVAEPSLAHS
ncbi:hypothetical protein BYT27DRAFT_6441229 [Phlegmacium glaucopus]|nr:hypothetical protein BYT27DRAFT_6441229 [Phlegmacium glaucopus]